MRSLKNSFIVLISCFLLGSVQAPKDKVAMFSFWATWCDACKVELTTLDKSAEFGKISKNTKFQIVLINLDRTPEEAQNWVKTNLKNSNFVYYYEPDFQTAETLKIDSFPTIVLFKNGNEIKRISQFNLESLLNDINFLLGE